MSAFNNFNKMSTAAVTRPTTTKLYFGENATVDQIRESLLKAPSLDSLEFDECSSIDDSSIVQFVHIINRKLHTLEARKLYKLTDSAVDLIAQRCKELQHVKFIACNNLGQRSIVSLGKYCKKLQSIAFIYENGTEWPLVDDVLSVLVGHFTSQLLAAAFVGFKGITDIGISYVAECFNDSLNAIDFSACTRVTDNSLIGIASNCRLLRSVAVNHTCITDIGLKAIADKCVNLQHVDVGNCQLTDSSIKYLADHCPLLEHINVENCNKVTSGSLRILTLQCMFLKIANFRNTGITKIPVTIVRLRHLSQLDVKMCKELSFPPPEIINKDVDGIIDFYRERNMGYRLRVMFLGDQGSGKSSLIQSLITDSASVVDVVTDGVHVQLWNPFNGTIHESLLERELTAEEKTLGLDMWDTSGRPVFQHCHQLFMTTSTLYVIVCNLRNTASCQSINQYLDNVQTKAPGSCVILVGTRLDQLKADEKTAVVTGEILKTIKSQEEEYVKNINTEIKRLRQFQSIHGSRIDKEISHLEWLLQHRPKTSDKVIAVSCYTAQGLDDVRKELLQKALDTATFPHLKSPFQVPTADVFDDILDLRKDGVVLVPWQQYKNLAMKEGRLEKEELLDKLTKFLQGVGGITKFDFPRLQIDKSDITVETPTICLHPEALAKMLCSLHVDDDHKAFKFQASRFWPAGKKPDPCVLVRALEEIPSRGLLRESLLPLLWKDFKLKEDQARLVLDLVRKLGFLVANSSKVKSSDYGPLALPEFPSLSTNQQYHLPLLQRLPENEPKLNWMPKPFKGDLQIGWRYEFENSGVNALITRLIAYCRKTYSQSDSYQYYWKHGVLLKVKQVHVNIVRDPERTNSLYLLGRITVDEEGEEKATEVLWVVLARFLYVTETYLADWKGLVTKVYIQSSPYYFGGDDVDACFEVPLLDCLQILDSGDTRLTASNGTRNYELKLDLLLPLQCDKTKDLLSWLQWMAIQGIQLSDAMNSVPDNGDNLPASPPIPNNQDNEASLATKIEKPAKRKGDIKWDLNEDKKKISEEDELKEANRVAAGFVAAILAGAMAQYVAEQYDKNNRGYSPTVTTARESALKASASAAKAAQQGDAQAAANAVVAAANAVDKAATKESKPMSNGTATSMKSSKMCQLL